MDRLFLDANILFSAAYREDPLSGLKRLWGCGVELITSDYAQTEAIRNLKKDAPDAAWSHEYLGHLMRDVRLCNDLPANGVMVYKDNLFLPRIELPDKDWPILVSAITCGATHLLTGDKKHFGPLFGREVVGVLICRPSEYLSSSSSM